MTRWLAGVGVSSLLVLTSATPAAAVPGPRNDQWWFKAWEVQKKVWPISKGAGVTVAVVDTGVNGNLPDLKGAVVPGTDLYRQGGGNGFIPPTADFAESHGTAMAAMIVGQGTGTGYVGVAPEAKVMAINAGVADWSKSIRFAVDNGAKVINFSQASSGTGKCRTDVQKAVAYAIERDVVVLAGSGNSGDASNPSMEPANCAGVVAVGAVDSQKRAWSRTERQPYVDVAAPGASVVALLANGQVSQRVAGTSASTALTSGIVAIMRSKYPQMSGREIVQRLLNTTKDAGPAGDDDLTGQGVVIPVAALTAKVPKSAPNSVYAEYDKWKQAHPNAVQGAQQKQQKEEKPAPKSDATKAGEQASENTKTLLIIVGAVLVVVLIVLFFVIWRSGKKKKAAAMGPGPGFGTGPQGGQQGPPPGWGGQQPGAPGPAGPQGGQQYIPPPQQGGMPPQGAMPPQQGAVPPQSMPPAQGPGGQYPPG